MIVDLRWRCVALVFVTADAASSWKAKLATTRIPEAVKQNILVRYDEQDLLVTCFRKESGLDAWIKSLLVTESHPIATEASWSVHPVAGMIRSLWLDACASSPGDAERGTKQDRAPTSLSLLPLSGSGSRLDAGEREKLKKKKGSRRTIREQSSAEQHFLVLDFYHVSKRSARLAPGSGLLGKRA